MRNSIIASAAIMASSALAAGTAHVVNACSYDVYMANTPSTGGGYDAIDKTLSAGETYSQQWTELSNGNGWSIKLAKTASFQTQLLQYEYTFHNDGTIWYDLSQVDGNPWDGDWMITASSGCSPKQQAYRYATDDAYGMQSCPDSSDITVTLCSADGGSDGAVSSAVAQTSSVAQTTEAPSSTWAAPSSTTTEASSTSATTESESEPTTAQGGWGSHHGGFTFDNNGFAVKAAEVTPSPSTFVTQVTTTSAGDYDVTVTNVVTEVATAYVTAGAKRHAHHPRHRNQAREE